METPTIGKTVKKTHRSYKCPNCSGEFDRWDRTGHEDSCPFCGLMKGMYTENEDVKEK